MSKLPEPTVVIIVDREFAAGNEAVWVEYKDIDRNPLLEVRVQPLLLVGSDRALVEKVRAELRYIADNLDAIIIRANEQGDLEVATMERARRDVLTVLREANMSAEDVVSVFESIDAHRLDL